MRHLRRLLADRLTDAGYEPAEAARTADIAVRTLLEAEAISSYRAESWERDAQIHYLLTHGAPMAAVQRCYQISRSAVYQAFERHLKRRRAAKSVGGEK